MKKKVSKEVPIFETFHFKPLAGLSPDYYVTMVYAIIVLATIYFLFIDQGLRKPQVRLRFQVLVGDASLYINGKFYHNLIFSPGWGASTVAIPAGETKLQIVKSGMEPWIWQQNFRANIWNNHWKPTTYTFQIQMTALASDQQQQYLWQEAWRGYLYRGLEGQKEISFDASHPYPWVLSEGLRSALYSRGAKIPAYWSADLQRGLASTTNIYQWGDLLTGYSLVSQAQNITTKNRSISLLGPRSLAILARSIVKRLQRLEPRKSSLFNSWKKAETEKRPQALQQKEFWQRYSQQKKIDTKQIQTLPAQFSGAQTPNVPKAVLEFRDMRFMSVPNWNSNARDFALQQTEVSNQQFARFWFSPAGKKLRRKKLQEGYAFLILYPEDQIDGPLGWPENSTLTDILQNPLLQDQPVRGITWIEAQAFAQWIDSEFQQQNQIQNQFNGSNLNNQPIWQLRLPSSAEFQIFNQSLSNLSKQNEVANPELEQQDLAFSFRIPQAPINFANQMQNLLGLKGIFGSLWEWHSDDYLPYLATNSANGSSNLEYKTISGGSWLNTLAISDGTRDLWASEFGAIDHEIPAQIQNNSNTIAGQFAQIRSPYTGFRLLAQQQTKTSNNPN